jgi:hypothetical protein
LTPEETRFLTSEDTRNRVSCRGEAGKLSLTPEETRFLAKKRRHKKPGFLWWGSGKTQLDYRRNPVSGQKAKTQETGFLAVGKRENSA